MSTDFKKIALGIGGTLALTALCVATKGKAKNLAKTFKKGTQFAKNTPINAKTAKSVNKEFAKKYLNGHNGMRTLGLFGVVGLAATSLSSCDLWKEPDFEHDHSLETNAKVNLKQVDIPKEYIEIIKRDTTYLPGDTIRDTIYVPGETVTDTIYQNDTVYIPGDTVRDTIYQDRVVHDTIFQTDTIRVEVPGEKIEIPDTLKPEPDIFIDKFTNEILKQNNDTTGVTVRLQGNKEYEQIFGRSVLVPKETSNKKMVFKTFNNYYEDDHNPKQYYTKTEVTVGELPDGRKGLYVSKIPSWAGLNQAYYSQYESDWNRANAQNEMIVESTDGKRLERHVRLADGKWVYAGTITGKEQQKLIDEHVLPESNQSWRQYISDFKTQSAVITKKAGEDWNCPK